MTYQIIETTDGKYHGGHIDIQKDGSIVMPDGVIIVIEKTVVLEDGLRLANSNYTIDVKELTNG